MGMTVTEKILAALDRNTKSTYTATKRIGSTMETLRSFARLDEAEFKQVDIHEALDSCLELIPPDTIGAVQVFKEYGEMPPIQAFAGRLNQVFMTLLNNAFESLKGEGTLTITTAFDGKEASISIADTGRGIAPDQLDRIFDIHFKAGEKRIKAGFPIAGCHSIVSQHHGDIKVASQVGRGSTFTITLPINLKSVQNPKD